MRTPASGGPRAGVPGLARRGGPLIVLAGIVEIVSTGAELILPAALGRSVDAALDGRGGPVSWVVLPVALVVVLATADILGAYCLGASGARATAWLRHRLVRHILSIDPRSAARIGAGDLVGRVVGTAPEAGQRGPALALLMSALLRPAGCLVALVLLDPWLGVTYAVGTVATGTLLRVFVRRSTAVTQRYQEVLGRIAGRLAETLSGSRTVAAAGTADREVERVLAPLPELTRHGSATWEAVGRAAGQAAFVGPLLQVAVVAVGGIALSAGRLTPGELFAASQYALLGTGLGAVVGVLSRLARAAAAARRVEEVLARPYTRYGDRELPAGPGRLELRGVTVRSEGRSLLADVDLDLPGGSTVAVVGRSGSGKSTLAALAGRLLDPDAGVVRLDGVPLAQLRHDALRRAVGSAFERPVLVGRTVAGAVGLADPRPTPGAVRAAVAAAQAHDFVRLLPEGYDTALSRAPMSGGERQRLGLARALSADRLLILDDATSSLDTATEMRIVEALTRDTANRTRLVIAHRASAAARADLVVWLDGGRVRAVDRHRRLWSQPDYRAVFGPDPDRPTIEPAISDAAVEDAVVEDAVEDAVEQDASR